MGGFIVNVGIGHRMSERVDLRAQMPTFMVGSGDDRDSLVVPSLTVTLGIGF